MLNGICAGQGFELAFMHLVSICKVLIPYSSSITYGLWKLLQLAYRVDAFTLVLNENQYSSEWTLIAFW